MKINYSPTERRCTWRRLLGNRGGTPQHSAASTETELPPIDTRDLWLQESRYYSGCKLKTSRLKGECMQRGLFSFWSGLVVCNLHFFASFYIFAAVEKTNNMSILIDFIDNEYLRI